MENSILFAFLLTFLAGISTLIGGIIAFFIKKENTRFLSLGLGFSAGVMIYISLVEIIQKASDAIGDWLALVSFVIGILVAALVDKLLPEKINQDNLSFEGGSSSKLQRTGIFVAIAIAIHNFPEGLATFMAGLSDVTLGISIAVAIAIHNIPEGIAVSMPIYNATGSRAKALLYTTVAGLAEPLGAIIGFSLLRAFFSDLTFGVMFALVAGIMIYIAFDELLPAAKEYGDGHIEIFGVTMGMLVMWVSLILLA